MSTVTERGPSIKKAQRKCLISTENEHGDFSNVIAETFVRVGPITYAVRLVHGVMEYDNGKTAVGLCHFEKCCLYISDTLAEQKRVTVFWHEYAHAVEKELNTLPLYEKCRGEPLARCFELAMMSISLKDMRRIERFLTSDLRRRENTNNH